MNVEHAASVAFLLLSAAPATAGVVVVDAAGGGDFTDLGAAVAAANAGDVLLLKTGVYPTADPLVLPNHGLALVADAGADVSVGELRSSGLPAGELLVLSGLNLLGDSGGQLGALLLMNGEGSIRIQNCTASAYDGNAVRVVSCSDVVTSRCTFAGGTPTWSDPDGFGNWGTYGLSVKDGRLAAYDCNFIGGDGEDAYGGGLFCSALGGSGGVGLVLQDDALLYAMGCDFEGGDGGDGFCGGEDGEGGTGLRLLPSPPGAGQPEAYLANAVFLPGASPNGVLASPYVGTPTFLNETRRELLAPAVVREGQAFTRTIIGRPGDRVFVPGSQDTRWRWLPPLGVLSLSAPIVVGPLLGVIGPGTSLVASDQAPVLAPGEEVRWIHEQVFVIKAIPQRLLGAAQVQFVLDSSF